MEKEAKQALGVMGVVVSGIILAGVLLGKQWDKESKEADRAYRISQRPIVAEVLSESYENSLRAVPESAGLVSYSNPTVTLDSKYTLKCRAEDGHIFGLTVLDGGTVTKESLDQLIGKGSEILFPQGNLRGSDWAYLEETYFKPGIQAGSKRADRIKVLSVE